MSFMAGNIAEVFGDTAWRMALPVFSSFGDGLTYPQRFIEDPELGLGNAHAHRQACDTLSTRGGSTAALNTVAA